MTPQPKSPNHTDHLSPIDQFRNSQEYLEREAKRLFEERCKAGLEGLVGDLACVIINVEPERQRSAVQDMQRYTGLTLSGAYRGPNYITAVLSQPCSTGILRVSGKKGTDTDFKQPKSESVPIFPPVAPPAADILIRSRRSGNNPFASLNERPRTRQLPNTRLETFVFECSDLARYVAIQKERGVRFVTDEIVRTDTYSFIQTLPSPLIGASYGFMQWNGPRTYSFADAEKVDWNILAPTADYRKQVGRLDHVATRLGAMDRDAAILEFIRLTNHRYEFSIYVESLNSITNVTRRSDKDVGLVFTSGISPYVDEASAGPTEKFVYNYGPRTHHLAFDTQDIEQTFAALKRDGMTFMVELVGGPDEGLHQTFTNPWPDTLIVTEYIHRYNGFTGYFTLSNVTALTQATAKQ